MISLLQLEYFRKLCATQHITHTAKQLYISQTALSSMIIGLEQELGVKLFDRLGRSIRLNASGKIYLKYVNDAFAALENGRNALHDLQDTEQKEVSLAVGSSLVWLPMLYEFHRRYPDCSIRQTNCTLARLRELLENREVDFVIAGLDDLPHKDLCYTEIREDRTYFCVSKQHHLANRASVSMRDLRDELFINLPVGTPWRAFCDKIFSQAGFPCKTVLECDYSLRAPLIESNFGAALTSSSAYNINLLKPNCYILVSDDYTRRPMALFWNPNKYLSRAALQFKEFCPSYYREKLGLANDALPPPKAALPAEEAAILR